MQGADRFMAVVRFFKFVVIAVAGLVAGSAPFVSGGAMADDNPWRRVYSNQDANARPDYAPTNQGAPREAAPAPAAQSGGAYPPVEDSSAVQPVEAPMMSATDPSPAGGYAPPPYDASPERGYYSPAFDPYSQPSMAQPATR